MIKAFKVRLKPNNKQKTKMFQYAGCARFAYNWALTREKENINLGCRFIRNEELRREFTQLKKNPEMQWINSISNNVPKQAIKDACDNYEKYLKGEIESVKFKTKKYSTPSFFQDPCKIKFTETHVKIEKFADSRKKNRQQINWIRLCEKGRIPLNCNYMNPRFTFDGLYWYVSVSVDIDESTEIPSNKGVGIDLGVINLAVCSDGHIYKSINKTHKVKKLEKRANRIRKSISRKYIKNKKGEKYHKTENIKKAENKILSINKKLKGLRENYICQTINNIIERKPSFICIEDLDVKGIMRRRGLTKAVQKQNLSEFRHNIIYKAKENNVAVIVADRFFPSSKRCIKCGNIKKDLTLSDRIYVCNRCGNIIDRDYQASLNLMWYGERAMRTLTV